MKFYSQFLSPMLLLLTPVVIQAYEVSPTESLACFFDQQNYQGTQNCYGVVDQTYELDSFLADMFGDYRAQQMDETSPKEYLHDPKSSTVNKLVLKLNREL